jgi:hypothetical protein
VLRLSATLAFPFPRSCVRGALAFVHAHSVRLRITTRRTRPDPCSIFRDCPLFTIMLESFSPASLAPCSHSSSTRAPGNACARPHPPHLAHMAHVRELHPALALSPSARPPPAMRALHLPRARRRRPAHAPRNAHPPANIRGHARAHVHESRRVSVRPAPGSS